MVPVPNVLIPIRSPIVLPQVLIQQQKEKEDGINIPIKTNQILQLSSADCFALIKLQLFQN